MWKEKEKGKINSGWLLSKQDWANRKTTVTFTDIGITDKETGLCFFVGVEDFIFQNNYSNISDPTTISRILQLHI